MFFTKAGFVIAWLMFVPGMVVYGINFYAAVTGNLVWASEVFGARMVASSSTASIAIAIGVGFGIASEISSTLASMLLPQDEQE